MAIQEITGRLTISWIAASAFGLLAMTRLQLVFHLALSSRYEVSRRLHNGEWA